MNWLMNCMNCAHICCWLGVNSAVAGTETGADVGTIWCDIADARGSPNIEPYCCTRERLCCALFTEITVGDEFMSKPMRATKTGKQAAKSEKRPKCPTP